MEAVFNSGITLILSIQNMGAWLLGPMKFFSFLGSEEFFLAVLPVIYWCVNEQAGFKIGTIVLFSSGFNDMLKLLFHAPRPYWYSTQVKALSAETSFGMPSGHAQISTGFWGMAATSMKKLWFWLVALLLICMIGFSRLYLAVHFPIDVALGWGIGAITLWTFNRWWDSFGIWIGSKSLKQQIMLAALVSALILLIGFLPFMQLNHWVIPAEWLENAQRAGTKDLPSPVSINTTITSAAGLFGMLVGLAWMNSQGGFTSEGTTRQKLLRLLPGIAGLVIFYLGLRAVFPRGDALVPYTLRFLRFALIGLWITAGAPWLFIKFNLAKKSK